MTEWSDKGKSLCLKSRLKTLKQTGLGNINGGNNSIYQWIYKLISDIEGWVFCWF